MTGTPPRWSVSLLRRTLPADVRDGILHDLDEVFQRMCTEHGVAAAERWYQREARSFAWRFLRERLRVPSGPIFSLIDVRLALRMVLKYPVLTVVGGLAIAIAIAITTVAFEITHDLSNPTLPLVNGDRVVDVQMWDGQTSRQESRLLYDLQQWRHASTVYDAGAYTTIVRNLVVAQGQGEPMRIAQMSPVGFRVAGVAPLMGRVFNDTDARPGAPAVIVIGSALWQTRFDRDPHIVGRVVHLGADAYTIVGVMPSDFAFPVSHSLWIPLSEPAASLERFAGQAVHVFARLADGVTMATAESEIQAISARQPRLDATTSVPFTPHVVSYATGLYQPGLLQKAYQLQALLVMLLVICCANVATLVFARTATRQNEIVVRTALGASRGRILGQFFVEALGLAVLGAAIGLAVANASIQWTMQLIWSTGTPRPFWWNDQIAPVTYGYAAGLTLIVAMICGIVPALKGTRGGINGALQQAAGRSSSLRFGIGWTAIIVLQVALCVALLPASLSQAWDAVKAQSGGVNFAASEYLSVVLTMDSDDEARRSATYRDLDARLRQEPNVRSVAFGERFPGMDHPRVTMDVEREDFSNRLRPESRTAVVAPGFFEALGVAPLAGRVFTEADIAAGNRVVVNQLFVSKVLRNQNAIGRRVRFAISGPSAPWFEVIGVVPDLGLSPLRPAQGAGLYLVAAPGTAGVDRMAIHVTGDAAAFAPRLRAIGLEVNPELQLVLPQPLDIVSQTDQRAFRFFAAALFAVGAVGVILATTGIYAMMSFTVSRRTREIAIRAALGANPRRLISNIFYRAALQIGCGAIAGALLVLLARPRSAQEVWLPLGLAGFMLVIGLFACTGPALRALRIEPSEALKDNG